MVQFNIVSLLVFGYYLTCFGSSLQSENDHKGNGEKQPRGDGSGGGYDEFYKQCIETVKLAQQGTFQPKCLQDFRVWGDSCYRAANVPANLNSATLFCKAFNATLAMPKSCPESFFLRYYVTTQENKVASYHLGSTNNKGVLDCSSTPPTRATFCVTLSSNAAQPMNYTLTEIPCNQSATGFVCVRPNQHQLAAEKLCAAEQF